MSSLIIYMHSTALLPTSLTSLLCVGASKPVTAHSQSPEEVERTFSYFKTRPTCFCLHLQNLQTAAVTGIAERATRLRAMLEDTAAPGPLVRYFCDEDVFVLLPHTLLTAKRLCDRHGNLSAGVASGTAGHELLL